MFSDLPQMLQNEVLHYISHDFAKAKAIYDEWLAGDTAPHHATQ